MTPTVRQRDALFKAFARALFRRDIAALYEAVAPDFVWSFHDGLAVAKELVSPEAIAAHLDEQKNFFEMQRFDDVRYHHLPEFSFMTCRVVEIVRETGERREQRAVEKYTFANGRLATKDVYRKPVHPAG